MSWNGFFMSFNFLRTFRFLHFFRPSPLIRGRVTILLEFLCRCVGYVKDWGFTLYILLTSTNGKLAHIFEFKWNAVLNLLSWVSLTRDRRGWDFVSQLLLCLKWVLFQFSFGQIVLLFLRNSILQETRTSLVSARFPPH